MTTPENTTISNPDTIPTSATYHTSDDMMLTILSDNFRNEQFEQNLAYFQQYQPALFDIINKHQCKEYQLCITADGNPNILHLASKTLVYSTTGMDEIISSIQHGIDNLSCNTYLSPGFIGGAPEEWLIDNPIQAKMLDTLYDTGIFKQMQLTLQQLTPLENYATDYLPMIRVYGIGLGYHLTELIRQKKISYMLIYEPHFDLFYNSLFTTPWNLIFRYFASSNKGINLALATSPEQAIASHQIFMESRLTPVSSLFYRFNYFANSAAINEKIQQESQADNVQRQQLDAGWYEDQRVGLFYAARNIRNNNKFYNGKKIKPFFSAFVVGSGPSLNESITYIKEHQQDAIIIACGSAMTPLFKAGITPDYVVVQERNWHLAELEQKHRAELKRVSLLKLNVVSSLIDDFYKETLIFQKHNDPGSVLMDSNYAITGELNPTVTNAGISMVAELGASRVYLFGVDYGVPEGNRKAHAKGTIYDDVEDDINDTARFKLTGNLGATIQSDEVLTWSLDTTEMSLKKHAHIQWYNVGEGAKIKGAIPITTSTLPKRFSKAINKPDLHQKITACFDNNYHTETIIKQLKTHYMAQVDEYCDALMGFTLATPQTREEITSTLSLMYMATNVGRNRMDFLPASLLAYGFKQFITDVYIQNGLQADEISATQFFEHARKVLADFIQSIQKDLDKLLLAIDNETDIEFYPSCLKAHTALANCKS